MLLRQFAQSLFGFGQFGAFFLDDFGWRLVNETGVGPVSYTHLTLPTNREV